MRSTEAVNNAAVPGEITSNMMQAGNTASELGIIKIHDNVLAALVSRAVLGVKGVSRLAGSAIIDNLAGMVGSHSRAIEIIKENEDKIRITVKVNICFGTVIPKVAVEVQRQIIEQLEKASGISVAAVDVVVQQLDDPNEDDDDTPRETINGVKVEALSASHPALSAMQPIP